MIYLCVRFSSVNTFAGTSRSSRERNLRRTLTESRSWSRQKPFSWSMIRSACLRRWGRSDNLFCIGFTKLFAFKMTSSLQMTSADMSMMTSPAFGIQLLIFNCQFHNLLQSPGKVNLNHLKRERGPLWGGSIIHHPSSITIIIFIFQLQVKRMVLERREVLREKAANDPQVPSDHNHHHHHHHYLHL